MLRVLRVVREVIVVVWELAKLIKFIMSFF